MFFAGLFVSLLVLLLALVSLTMALLGIASLCRQAAQHLPVPSATRRLAPAFVPTASIAR